MVEIKNMKVTLAMKVPLKLGNKGKKKDGEGEQEGIGKEEGCIFVLLSYAVHCPPPNRE